MNNFFNCNFIFFTCLFRHVSSITPCDMRTELSKSQFKEKISAMNRPLLEETVTTSVNVSVSINDLNIIDIKSLDLEMDLEITERWYDHRLAADYKTRKLAVREKIWQPKITFVIGNKICPDISAENADETQFWRGTSNGSVFYSERFLVRPKCTSNLARYPFDSQTCSIKIGSYRFTADEVSLVWNYEKPVELRREKELGEFQINKLTTYDETDSRSAGKFSVLVLEIQMIRYCHREVLQSFAPSFVLVKIAYGSLWTNSSDIRTRIFTCLSLLFGILFLFTISNNSTGLSNTTYFKALDVWFLMCFFFVLVPLIETLIVFRCSNRLSDDIICRAEIECTERQSTSRKLEIWMKKIFRIVYPMLFVSSTTLFFMIYLNDAIIQSSLKMYED